MENVITIQAASTVNKSYLLQTNVSVLSLRELYCSFMADEFSKDGMIHLLRPLFVYFSPWMPF